MHAGITTSRKAGNKLLNLVQLAKMQQQHRMNPISIFTAWMHVEGETLQITTATMIKTMLCNGNLKGLQYKQQLKVGQP